MDMDACLSDLCLSDAEAAALLSVYTRIRCWKKSPDETPSPPKAAFSAWQKLSELGPRCIALSENGSQALAEQNGGHADCARGGPNSGG